VKECSALSVSSGSFVQGGRQGETALSNTCYSEWRARRTRQESGGGYCMNNWC